MAIDRRKVLKIAGATVVVAGGALAWRAYDRGVFSAGTGPAYVPWKTWGAGQPGDPLRLVHAAILAANPHNSQPWIFRVGDDSIDLFADTRRNIGAIDPFLREMYMGVGCALENLLIAAAHDGYRTTVTLMPDAANTAHAARISLSPAARASSDLYDAIPKRHTNRAPYDTGRAVAPEQLAQLAALAAGLRDVKVIWFTMPEERKRIGDLIVAATEAIIADEEQSMDSAKWFRWLWDEVQTHRDGLTLDAQDLPPLIDFAAKVLPPMSREAADAGWFRATREHHVTTAAAFGFIAAPGASDHASHIRGGQLWQRMHLKAAVMGLAAHPLNQMPERADRERQLGIEPRFGNALREMVGDPELRALMPFRIGYPTAEAKPSPRRDLKSVLI
jgi:nitroreductase